VDNPIPLVGGQVVFTLKVTNNGPSAAANVVVTETYPAGFTFISAIPSPDALTDNQWTFASMAAQEEQTITITGKATGGGCWINKAAVSSDTEDPDTANNTATAEVKPLGIMVSKVASPAYACAGQEVRYTVIVHNLSCTDLRLISFTDTMLGDISSHFQPILPEGAVRSWSYSYTIKDTDPDPLDNFATAHYQTLDSLVNLTDTGSVSIRCAPVVGG